MTNFHEWIKTIPSAFDEINFIDLHDTVSVEKYSKPQGKQFSKITLYSSEWESNPEVCKSFIGSKLGLFDTKLGARKCELKTVDKLTGRAFLDKNHIQGASNLALQYFGLFFKDELVALASLGRHTRNIAKNRIVLDRLCFKGGVHITGGFGKLLKACIKWASDMKYDELITFSDNRVSSGNVYEVLGFTPEVRYNPDYFYVDSSGAAYSKQSQKKDITDCPESLTEFEWASYRGLKRIYDLGKIRWVLNINPSNQTWQNKNSEKCAKMHQSGVFKHSHIRGYFYSGKNNASIYYGSSYELRCLSLLECDSRVASFRRADAFKSDSGNWRNPDLLVTFNDGCSSIFEVKPEALLTNPAVIDQISDSEKYSKAHGYGFKIWTEKDSELLADKDIIKWAVDFLKETNNDTKWAEHKKLARIATAARYNEKHPDIVLDIFCSFCNESHKVRKKSYDANIAKNKTYICEKHGGHIAGSKPKLALRKENPFAVELKKQCITCTFVKPFEDFHKVSRSRDGLDRYCKVCALARQNERRKARKLCYT
jgi:hypothetical protein